MVFVVILSRWLHVLAACLAVGGLFFARVVMPAGLAALDPDTRQAAMLKIRRRFKMVIHSAILLLLITGLYNTTVAWHLYKLKPEILHMLWGIHLLLALLAFTIALYVLAGAMPPAGHLKWMTINLVVLALVIAAASSLKWAREKRSASIRRWLSRRGENIYWNWPVNQ